MAKLSPVMTIKQVRSLALTMDDDEISALTGVPLLQVMKITKAMPVENWWGRNEKTGETVTGRGHRGIYRQVCARGWVEWTWGIGSKIGENQQP